VSTAKDSSARIRALEIEVGALRQQLGQREDALKILNRRLLELERGEHGTDPLERIATAQLVAEKERILAENGVLASQLESLQQTKILRWSAPARQLYARVRGSR
jgi:hypothetical protein